MHTPMRTSVGVIFKATQLPRFKTAHSHCVHNPDRPLDLKTLSHAGLMCGWTDGCLLTAYSEFIIFLTHVLETKGMAGKKPQKKQNGWKARSGERKEKRSSLLRKKMR